MPADAQPFQMAAMLARSEGQPTPMLGVQPALGAASLPLLRAPDALPSTVETYFEGSSRGCPGFSL